MNATPHQRIDVCLPAEPASIPELRHAVTAFVSQHDAEDPPAIGLAVTEAATNAVLHAYIEKTPGDVRVVVCAEPEQLVVVVRDWGDGMRPRPDSPGLGLGLPTIAALATSFKIEAADGAGTLLRMHFGRVRVQAA